MSSKPVGPQVYKGFNFKLFKPANNPTMELFYAVMFIKNFITPWTELPAYKLGIIDVFGRELKTKRDLKTAKEKSEYSPLNRLAWEFKRTIENYPGLTNKMIYKLWNMLVSKFVVKEAHSEGQLQQTLTQLCLWEERNNTPYLEPGFYRVITDLVAGMAKAGDIIQIKNKTPSMGMILGKPTYIVFRGGTDPQTIIISDGEYQKIDSEELDEDISNTTDNISLVPVIDNLHKKKKYNDLFVRLPFVNFLADKYT
jgi:hypothetical protein